jgi:hypothetical protein
MSRSRSWWEIGVPLRYRGSHRPTGAYMGTRWRTRSPVPERRGRGTPTQVAKSGAILDIDEALRGLARSRLCVAGVRGGPSVSYRPSVAGLSIWGSSREHTCDLRPPGATDPQRPGASVDPEGCLGVVDPRTSPPTVGFWLSRGRRRSVTAAAGSGHAAVGGRDQATPALVIE